MEWSAHVDWNRFKWVIEMNYRTKRLQASNIGNPLSNVGSFLLNPLTALCIRLLLWTPIQEILPIWGFQFLLIFLLYLFLFFFYLRTSLDLNNSTNNVRILYNAVRFESSIITQNCHFNQHILYGQYLDRSCSYAQWTTDNQWRV